MIRSYHREYISSRLITEIKHDWASTVVATEMGCEVDVTNLLLFQPVILPSISSFLLLFSPVLLLSTNLAAHPALLLPKIIRQV